MPGPAPAGRIEKAFKWLIFVLFPAMPFSIYHKIKAFDAIM